MFSILAYETERQKESIPIIVRRIALRIIPLYLLAVLALGMTVSPDDPILTLPSAVSATQAPPYYPGGFVLMAERAGIPVLPSLINFVMMVAAASTAAADIYMAVSSDKVSC
jgi:yeast amino acid transporter